MMGKGGDYGAIEFSCHIAFKQKIKEETI